MTDSESDALRSAIDSSKGRHITFPQALGYGIGDVFGGGQLTLITTYLSLFWTRFCGMDIATSQSVIGMSALVSALAALLFGVLDDNLYRYDVGRRFGRRRFLLMLTSPLLLFGVFLWIPGLPLAAYAAAYVLWVVLAQMFATSRAAGGDDDRFRRSHEAVDRAPVHLDRRDDPDPAGRQRGPVRDGRGPAGRAHRVRRLDAAHDREAHRHALRPGLAQRLAVG